MPSADATAAATRRFDRVQRAVDSALVIAAAPLWLPVLGAGLGAALLSGHRPPIFRQVRMGRGERPFTIYKLRTMRDGLAPPAGALFAGWTYAGDPRVSRTGAFLRRYRIDELPQLWNVLRGEMSLVGPRPEPYEIGARLGAELHGYRDRHAVRPGLTGLCQVSRVYREFGTLELSARKLEFDLEYVRRRGLRLQARILARTLAVLVRGEGMA